MTLILQSIIISLFILLIIIVMDRCADDHLERKDWPLVLFVSVVWPLGVVFILCGIIVIFGDE